MLRLRAHTLCVTLYTLYFGSHALPTRIPLYFILYTLCSHALPTRIPTLPTTTTTPPRCPAGEGFGGPNYKVEQSKSTISTLQAKGSAGVEMLTHILRRREECAGETYIATGEAHYILGLLHQYCGDPKEAQTHIRTALGIYENQLGPEHHSTKDVARSLAQLCA